MSKILLVEDDQRLSDLVQSYLTQHGLRSAKYLTVLKLKRNVASSTPIW